MVNIICCLDQVLLMFLTGWVVQFTVFCLRLFRLNIKVDTDTVVFQVTTKLTRISVNQLMVATVWLTRRSPSKNNEDGNANIRQLPEIILNIRRIINEITRIQQCPQRHHYAIAMIPLPWDTCMYFKTQTERIKLMINEGWEALT